MILEVARIRDHRHPRSVRLGSLIDCRLDTSLPAIHQSSVQWYYFHGHVRRAFGRGKPDVGRCVFSACGPTLATVPEGAGTSSLLSGPMATEHTSRRCAREAGKNMRKFGYLRSSRSCRAGSFTQRRVLRQLPMTFSRPTLSLLPPL